MKIFAIAWISRLAGAALLAVAPGASGQAFPAKAVRLVVPSSPGGGGDFTARIIAPKLSEYLRQQIVVENRAGANTMIGTEAVARAAPDGYTLLVVPAPFVINPAMYRKIPYDVVRDFAPVTQVVSLPNLLISHPSLPVKTVKELIAFAKAKPAQLAYASAGTGSSPHMSMELFASLSGLRLVHVPYKGAGPGVLDVIAGHVPVMMPSIVSSLGHVRIGRLRGLGVTSRQRASAAPDIPTIAETGVPGYEAVVPFGIAAPAGTPREIVNLLQAEIARVLQLADVKARLLTEGAEPVGSSPDEFGAFIRSEIEKWIKVVKNAGIQPE